jgi:rhodanese-related sulfurtransferase
VPLDVLDEHRQEIAHLSHPVVLVCQSGNRAAKAEEALRPPAWPTSGSSREG